jgi:hypothetical protein
MRANILDTFTECCSGYSFGQHKGFGTMVEEEQLLLAEVVGTLASMGEVRVTNSCKGHFFCKNSSSHELEAAFNS